MQPYAGTSPGACRVGLIKPRLSWSPGGSVSFTQRKTLHSHKLRPQLWSQDKFCQISHKGAWISVSIALHNPSLLMEKWVLTLLFLVTSSLWGSACSHAIFQTHSSLNHHYFRTEEIPTKELQVLDAFYQNYHVNWALSPELWIQ